MGGIVETSTLEGAGGNPPTSVLTVGTRARWTNSVLLPRLMLPRPESSSLPEVYETLPPAPILEKCVDCYFPRI
jgi:hypothetical protein